MIINETRFPIWYCEENGHSLECHKFSTPEGIGSNVEWHNSYSELARRIQTGSGWTKGRFLDDLGREVFLVVDEYEMIHISLKEDQDMDENMRLLELCKKKINVLGVGFDAG